MDQINITGIHAKTVIGVYDWERQTHRPIIIDVTLHRNLQQAAQSDDVRHTVDYAEVVEWICQQSHKARYQLLEALATHLAKGLLAEFRIEQITLTLHKPRIIDNVDDVSVCITRP